MEKLNNENLVYSLDKERFYSLEDILTIINDLTLEAKQSENAYIYIGSKIERYHKDYFDIDNLFESITDAAYDNADEYASNYINNFESMKDEDKEKISSLILKVLNENIPQPDFFGVENIKQLQIMEFVKSQQNGENE